MLTSKQHDLLMFIYDRLKDTGVPPSFEEMKDALGLKSKSGIHRLITALEERGFLRRLPHRARAMEIIRMPDASAPGLKPVPAAHNTHFKPNFKPSVIEGSLGKAIQDNEEAGLYIPMMGRIAAGVPISAIQDHSHNVSIPPDMLGQGEHYALEVKGDSMINAGILDGDTVLIRKTNTARNGDIVVALVDDEEATLKRLRKKGDTIALEAANPAYETRTFGPDRIDVQGVLAGLLRSY